MAKNTKQLLHGEKFGNYTNIITSIPTAYLDQLVIETGISDIKEAIQFAVLTYRKPK